VFSGYGPSSKVSATPGVPVIMKDPPGPTCVFGAELALGLPEVRAGEGGVADGGTGEGEGEDAGDGPEVGDFDGWATWLGVGPPQAASSSVRQANNMGAGRTGASGGRRKCCAEHDDRPPARIDHQARELRHALWESSRSGRDNASRDVNRLL